MDGDEIMALGREGLIGCLCHDAATKDSIDRARMNTKSSGQMTVEFVIAFPVALVIALCAVNVLLFFSECAAFDRLFRSLVCTYAASPGYEQTVEQSCARIQEALETEMSADYLEIEVQATGGSGGLVTFQGELQFTPSLFGRGSLKGAFGVVFSPLVHYVSLTVDVYKPGVFL